MLASCTEPVEPPPPTETREVKVAVILPLGGGMRQRWERTLEWVRENMETAQRDLPSATHIDIEWYDEDAVDITATAAALAQRGDIAAIIGPMYSSNTQLAAAQCARTKKTLITTTASSAELIRSSAGKHYLWALSETDISQCEVLLSKAMMQGAKTVSLLAKEDLYGQTFIDWFAFQAAEFGLAVGSVQIYTDDTLTADFTACASVPADYMICVPSSAADVETILRARGSMSGSPAGKTSGETPGETPRLLFSDVAYMAELDALGSLAEGIEGVAMSADPSSGFAVAYEVRFGEQPLLGEAQAYDALSMIYYAAAVMARETETGGETGGGSDMNAEMNAALCALVDGRDPGSGSWMAGGMRAVLSDLAAGASPDIRGASGSLDFDAQVYTNVLHSVYLHWTMYDGRFVVLDYNTSDGGRRTDATLAGWNWRASHTQQFDRDAPVLSFPPLGDQWALVVAASSGWLNYRHQADAMRIYHLLRERGYDDDHIVLILADDLADNPRNPYPGVVTVSPEGPDLYSDIRIDYRLADLSPGDITEILMGAKSERLPEVISSGPSDNVLVFWSGHGSPGAFVWDDVDGFTTSMMHSTLRGLHEGEKYRKMLWLVETCYAGSVARAAEGIPESIPESVPGVPGGIPEVMFITASADNETSKADLFSDELGVWMTNRFTGSLYGQLESDPDISMRELYIDLFRNTTGSHVTVYNNTLFDNLYTATMEEFL
jgi:glycosylphosphatidylinositol transamidase (GPIT) subunit GPI8/ABC-type branched-subunit amino acid transport system substrate-binding protein